MVWQIPVFASRETVPLTAILREVRCLYESNESRETFGMDGTYECIDLTDLILGM